MATVAQGGAVMPPIQLECLGGAAEDRRVRGLDTDLSLNQSTHYVTI